MARVNLLYLVPVSGLGGVETFLIHTAKYHSNNNLKPIYCFFRTGPLWEELKKYNVEMHLLPFVPRLSRPHTCVWICFWLFRFLLKEKINLIHSTTAYAALFGSVVAFFARRKHLWFQHGPVSGWIDLLASILPSEKIYVNSNYTFHRQKNNLRFLSKIYRIEKKMELVRLGADIELANRVIPNLDVRKEFRNKWNVEEEDFVIGMLCRAQRWKGIELFIQAMSLAQKQNEGVALRGVVLTASPLLNRATYYYENHLARMCKKLDCGVEIVESTSNPMQAMQSLDLVLNASITPEPYGLTLVEAMALGKLTLAPREGGPLEIMEAEHTGCFFTARNFQDLSSVILSIKSDVNRYRRICESARKIAKSEFSAESTVKNLEKKYLELFV